MSSEEHLIKFHSHSKAFNLFKKQTKQFIADGLMFRGRQASLKVFTDHQIEHINIEPLL